MRNLLSRKAMLASVTITLWSARRVDKKVTDEVNQRHGATSDAGRYNKLLIARDGLDMVAKAAGAARTQHYDMTQPWLDNGSRILASALYMNYRQTMDGLKSEFERAANEFEREYPAYVEDAERRLNGMFRPDDYPPPHDIRSRFTFEVKVLPCPDASDFRIDIAQEHAEDIRRDVEQRMKQALNDAMGDTVRRVVETVGHMADRLRAFKPATRKSAAAGVFRDSLVENVRDLARLLPAFNLIESDVLADVARRIERELCAENAQSLRDSAKLRKTVADSAKRIVADVSAFMA
jgi:hypothetical protein